MTLDTFGYVQPSITTGTTRRLENVKLVGLLIVTKRVALSPAEIVAGESPNETDGVACEVADTLGISMSPITTQIHQGKNLA